LLIKNIYTIAAVARRAEGEFLFDKEKNGNVLISITSGNSGINTINQRSKKLVTTRAWIKRGIKVVPSSL
jgi:hypothetical protein